MRYERRTLWRFFPILWPLLVAGCGFTGAGRLDRIQLRIAELRQKAVADSGSGLGRTTPVGHADATAGKRMRSFRQVGWRRSRHFDSLAGRSPPNGKVPDRRPGPLPGFFDTLKRDVQAMPADLWTDIKAVYGSPGNLAILGLGYGGSLAMQIGGVDDTIEDSLAGENIFSDDVNVTFSVLGNPGVHLGLAGLWYLIGQQTENERTYQVGKTLISALIINGLSTTVGKYATWDRAPNGELFTFPSGHTSSTFTLASVLHRAYGPWVGIPLYGLGVLVAVERLDDDEHYFSDVLMGSVMGLVIGHTVAGERDLELYGGRVIPYTDPATGSVGLAWHKRF